MDFVQILDPFKLLLGGTVCRVYYNAGVYSPLVDQGLSFFLTLGASPPYNLPIFLFGNYALESNDAVRSLQTVSFSPALRFAH
jgi:hypothetical protein